MDYGKLCEGRAIWAATCCTVPSLHRVGVRKEGARAKSLNGKHYREVGFFPGRPGDPARWIGLRHSQVAQIPSLRERGPPRTVRFRTSQTTLVELTGGLL